MYQILINLLILKTINVIHYKFHYVLLFIKDLFINNLIKRVQILVPYLNWFFF